MITQCEGWLGDDYVRIYATADRSRVSKLYDFPAFLPAYELWGSWGLDALCLGLDSQLYLIDWIPLHESFRKLRFPSIQAFERTIGGIHEATPAYQHFQKEVHLVTPLVFGGDPSQKFEMIDQTAHAKLCNFWNRTYARLKGSPTQ